MLWAALLCGALLRFSIASWGLPYNYHVDERLFVVQNAAEMEWRGLVHDDFRPRISTYGPALFELALLVRWTTMSAPFDPPVPEADPHAYDSAYAYATQAFDPAIVGQEHSLAAWITRLRFVSALFGTLATLFLSLFVLRLRGVRPAAFVSIFSALSVGLLQQAHFYTSDSLLLFLTALCLYLSSFLDDKARVLPAILCGATVASIAAVKLTGLAIAACVPVGIAGYSLGRFPRQTHFPKLLESWCRALWTRRFFAFVMSFALVLFTLNPWLFFDPSTYFTDVPSNQNAFVVSDALRTERFVPFYSWRFPYNGLSPSYWWTHVLRYALGLPLLLLAVAGLCRAPFSREPLRFALLLITIVNFLWIADAHAKTIRYAVPMLIPLVLLAVLLLEDAMSRLGRVAGALAAAFLISSAAYGLAFSAMFFDADSRTGAARYVTEHVESGDAVVVGPDTPYTAPFNRNELNVGRMELGNGLSPPPGVRIRRLFQGNPLGDALTSHLNSTLSTARFLLIDDYYRAKIEHPWAESMAPNHVAFLRALDAGQTGFERVATFRREPTLGPLVWDESDDEILARFFDHVGVEVWERTGQFENPLE